MLKASPGCNVVLVEGDPGRDVDLVGVDDAAGGDVVRVQARADCVFHRIGACDVIVIRAGGATGDVQHGVVVGGGADHHCGWREERGNHLQICRRSKSWRLTEGWSLVNCPTQLTLIFIFWYFCICPCFVTNINAANMKNTAGKSAN